VLQLARNFERKCTATVSHWSNRIDDARRRGLRVAMWGAGAKGTIFMNVVPCAAAIESVVDLNPRKRGMYVPGTGHRVIAPEELKDNPPDVILVVNPLYESEVAKMTQQLGLQAELAPIVPVELSPVAVGCQ